MILSKTRIAVFLSVALAIGVAGFVFGPALLPQASEELAPESADSDVKAQGSTPSAEQSAGSCNATFSGIIMHRFGDGSVLFRFGEGHRVRVEAPIGGERRNVVTTYGDGTGLVEDFPSGSRVEELPYLDPLSEGWYDRQGKPQDRPPGADYPDLWPRIAEEFFPDGDPSLPWEDDDWTLPDTIEERELIFGPLRERFRLPNAECEVYYNGVRVCYYPPEIFGPGKLGLFIVQFPNGDRLIQDDEGRKHWRRKGGPNPYQLDVWLDGTSRRIEYPSGTPVDRFRSTEPLAVVWYRDGRRIDAPSEGYSDISSDLPEEVFGEYYPEWEDPEWIPPNDPGERERIHGPLRRVEEGPDRDDYFYEDGFVYSYWFNDDIWRVEFPDPPDKPQFRRIMYTGDRQNIQRRGYQWGRGIAVCDVEAGIESRYRWPDGTQMVRVYPAGTTADTLDDTQPVCEQWYDTDGNPRDPGDPERYPDLFKQYNQK